MEQELQQGAKPKVEHKNIYEALSAFQGENPEITKTKDFGKETDKMHFKYAPLDEILKVVRPLLFKHGLSVTWESGGEDKIVCALYHNSYGYEISPYTDITEKEFEGVKETKSVPAAHIEKNVLRSLPIKVSRSGEMKEIGKASTYSRRYTIQEVLGIASDDDNDASIDKQTAKKAQGFAYTQAKKNIEGSTDASAAQTQTEFLEKDLALIKDGKTSAIGLNENQLKELLKLAQAKGKALLQ